MIDVLPLFLLWAATKKSNGKSAAVQRKTREPKWPTPSSPPPIPAFQPRPTPTADPGGTSTPLAELHAAPPTVTPANAIETTKQAAKPQAAKPQAARQAATAALRKRAPSLVRQGALSLNPFAAKKKPAPPATSSALVSQLQKILSSHGVRVTRDGLYGPKTATAWSALARKKGLAPAISREGPKVAKVVTQTFEQLSVPPIP